MRAASARRGRSAIDMRSIVPTKRRNNLHLLATLAAMAATPPAPQAAGDDKLDRGVLLIASVVVLGAIMSILDVTVVNVAINTLAKEFDAPLSTIQWVVDRLHAGARHRDPAHRLGRRPLRHQAPLPDLDLPLRVRLDALGPRVERRVADRLPDPPGLRRRHDHAARHDDPDPRRRPAARRPRDGDHRRPDAAGPDPRPDPRRLAGRRRLLALDLLHQPADRDRRADRVPAHPGARRAAARASPRRGRARAAVARARAAHLRPCRDERRRRLRPLAGHRPGAGRARHARRLRAPRPAHAATR